MNSSSDIESMYHQGRLEDCLFDRLHFEKLLRIAIEILLSKPPRSSIENTPDVVNSERLVLEGLGIRGLRAALEIISGKERYLYTQPEYIKDNDSQSVLSDLSTHPLSNPEIYSLPIDSSIVSKIMQFGKQLIHEAYVCLGPESDIMVKRFAEAKSKEEQIEVLEWLDNRLKNIAQSNRGLTTEHDNTGNDYDESIYHPLRISPKAIGTYPNHNLSPTCLGVALMGAGFFEKAGATYMKAGVMETASQGEILETIFMIHEDIETMCVEFGVSLPDNITTLLRNKVLEIMNAYTEDRGTHSALYVRLIDNSWYQFDPNLFSSTVVPKVRTYKRNEGTNAKDDTIDEYSNPINEEIELIHDTLVEFETIAPGLALNTSFTQATIQTLWKHIIHNILKPDDIRNHIEATILEDDGESFIEKVRKLVVDELLLQPMQDDVATEMQEKYLKEFDILRPDANSERTIDRSFYDAFLPFVLWGMSLDDWLIRCKKDKSFRDNRIEDILRLPILIGVTFGIHMMNRYRFNEPRVHTKLEFSLPIYDLGISALNNVDLYTTDSGTGLSPHFWATYSTSIIPIGDRLEDSSRSNTSDTLIRMILEHHKRNLQFARFIVSINEHLQQREGESHGQEGQAQEA